MAARCPPPGPGRAAGTVRPSAENAKYAGDSLVLADQSSFHRRGVGGDVYSLSYRIFASRKSGGRARVKRTTFSPVVVLMSWCRDTTLTPVTFSTMASMMGRAVSIKWVRTCFSKSRPFLGGKRLDQVLLGGGQDPLQADDEEIAEQVGVDVLGASPHVILLEAAYRLHISRLRSPPEFSREFLCLRSHGNRF